MHITSLPSKYGIGVMGEETKRFIRRIKDMGFSYWQVLPLCPTDFYGSPYASPAAFALSPLLIDPDTLKNDGFVSEDDLARSVYYGSPYTADYEFAAKSRRELLKIAYQNKKNEVSAETEKFCEASRFGISTISSCRAKFLRRVLPYILSLAILLFTPFFSSSPVRLKECIAAALFSSTHPALL